MYCGSNVRPGPPPNCCRNPIGCEDIGCCDPVCCPPPPIHRKPMKPKCEEIPCDPCKIMQCFPSHTSCCPRPFYPSPPCCSPPPCCPPPPCRPAPACCPQPSRPPRSCCPPPQPYACNREPDNVIYRCCESMSSSYAGHIPGFLFHSNGRTTGKATWGTKQYMNKCFYFNTFSKP